GETAGVFDYYVMALSWNSTWCAIEGDARGADQCRDGLGLGWTLHGLWPQYETGWPSYCRTSARDPSRSMTRSMSDIMGSGGLAWHQWKKHGRCTGLSAEDYFEASRGAYGSVNRPPVLRKLPEDIKVPVSVVEEAWLQSNPGMSREEITITCRDGRIHEARVCLTKDFELRRCGSDVIRDCRNEGALLEVIR
ncbi:MAG: ribonuclease T2, partial [Pseudomonadota bacterium]